MSILSRLETPIFAAEGIPEDTNPATWALEIAGLAQKPMTIPLADLKKLPPAKLDARLTSVSGWSVRAEWTGALFADFMKAHPPKPEATHATFASPGGYTTTVPLEILAKPRVLWVWEVSGEELEADYGGPLRMIVPPLWGYKSCKWVMKVEFVDRMIPGYWEVRGYDVLGEIEPGVTLDVNTKKTRKIKAGEVTEF
jgi:DMSO/TMAO reductase YedYZ molybdopterin-dependent catalytic subunit